LKLMMTGLDHKRSPVGVREKFAATKAGVVKSLEAFKAAGAGGCVIVSTCNRTELYVSAPDDAEFPLSETLCAAMGVDFSEYGTHLAEREGESVMGHLCRVAAGLDSRVLGDDRIITQVREALELSRSQNCADSYMETMFNMSIHAAKVIKTKVFINSLGTSSVPEKTVEKIKTICGRPLSGQTALVIGGGRIGRHVAELFIRENMNVTVTLRSHRGGAAQIPDKADTVGYDERYKAAERADIAVSATSSPHLTLSECELIRLKRMPEIIVDLAVPRDVEPSIGGLDGVTLLTIDDISDNGDRLPPESAAIIDRVIAEHIMKYDRWLKGASLQRAFFPLFVDMAGRKALIIGGGGVAERRAKVLARFGADITVISPEASEYIERAASSNVNADINTIRLIRRKYEEGDVAAVNPFIVIAATGDRPVNRAVMTEAAGLNILASIADRRDECAFYFPAIAENENYVVGIVSKNGGHSGVKETAEKIRGVINR
jgi:glutamyl-tRNA reductase